VFVVDMASVAVELAEPAALSEVEVELVERELTAAEEPGVNQQDYSVFDYFVTLEA
jgi:hypothetical protein